MPHLTLEYTDNIHTQINFEQLFSKLHTLLHELANAEINSCKSRAIKLTNYFIGDGSKPEAFVHLDISLLAGRTDQAKQELGKLALALLEHYFHSETTLHTLQTSVKITDIPVEFYFKRNISL